MFIDMRLYRRYDSDLLMLEAYGISIPLFAQLVLEQYAAGKLVKYRLPGCMMYIPKETGTVRYRFKVESEAVTRLFRSVKPGYRNQFCKHLIRDALSTEPLGIFFSNKDGVKLENSRLLNTQEESVEIGILQPDNVFDAEKTVSKKIRKMLKEFKSGSTSRDVKKEKKIQKENPKNVKTEAVTHESPSGEETGSQNTAPPQSENGVSAAKVPLQDAAPVQARPNQSIKSAEDDGLSDLFGNPEPSEEQEKSLSKEDKESIFNMFNEMVN